MNDQNDALTVGELKAALSQVPDDLPVLAFDDSDVSYRAVTKDDLREGKVVASEINPQRFDEAEDGEDGRSALLVL